MPADRTLLQALTLDPADAVAWLALADSLEEAGEEDSAALVRLTRELEAQPPDSPRRGPLQRRIDQLLTANVTPIRPTLLHPLGFSLVLLHPGVFQMGSPLEEDRRHEDEWPHEVHLTQPFWMSTHLITQRQYHQVMGYNPSSFRPLGEHADLVEGHDTDSFPIDFVSWLDAVEFCSRLSRLESGVVYRLPTEAEWEYACRAGSTAPFGFGDQLTSFRANFDGSSPYGSLETGPHLNRPCPVGMYWPNAWGIYDMHGQLDEWCLDWYSEEYYQNSPREDPTGPEQGDMRVLRGGTWGNSARFCRSAFRWRAMPDLRQYEKGFRIVREFLPR